MAKTFNVSIWQIKMKDDANNKVFMGYSNVMSTFGGIALRDYTKVYSCRHVTTETNTNTILDEIYARFNNSAHPNDYKGRSISVSDIICLDGVMYYVDKFGFKKIDMIM